MTIISELNYDTPRNSRVDEFSSFATLSMNKIVLARKPEIIIQKNCHLLYFILIIILCVGKFGIHLRDKNYFVMSSSLRAFEIFRLLSSLGRAK